MSAKTPGGYGQDDGRWSDDQNIDLSYGAQVPNGTAVYSGEIEVGSKAVLNLTLNVTQLGATHLDVTIWTRHTPADAWRVAQGGLNGTGLFAHVEATGSQTMGFLVDRRVRAEFHNAAAATSTSTLTGTATGA